MNDPKQPPMIVPGYLKTELRSPAGPLWPLVDRAALDAERAQQVEVDPAEYDLSVISPGRPRALGQLIVVSGVVLDEEGRPVRNAMIEMWQANSAGKYLHHNDPSPVPVDPNFLGFGRVVTDAYGRYRFRTIKPGGYAVPDDGPGSASDWWRPPHIHLSIFGPTFGSRLVTQMYFPGEPLNASDLLLNSIRDRDARLRLISKFTPTLSTRDGALGYEHDLVLSGRYQTPFEDE